MKVLAKQMEASEAKTVMELNEEMRLAEEQLKAHTRFTLGPSVSIPVDAACFFFFRYYNRQLSKLSMQTSEFDVLKGLIVKACGAFVTNLSNKSRERVAHFGHKFVGDGNTVLVHGFSRAVMSVLQKAAASSKNFDVIVLEGRPDCLGYSIVQKLAELKIPSTLVMDSAMALVALTHRAI